MDIRPHINIGISKSTSFQIGTYDKGLFDLEDKVTLSKSDSFKTQNEALKAAKATPGAEFIVERSDKQKGKIFDVYKLKIHDKGQSIQKLQDAENLKLFEQPFQHIEANTRTSNSIKGFIVAENGELSKPIYKQQFPQTRYDYLKEVITSTRELMGFDKNKPWFWVVDSAMSMPSDADSLPDIDTRELNHMKEHIQPGDIIMNGNNGSFIHGIVYVGDDKEIQAQLEKNWGLTPGELDGEGMIIHSLVIDDDTETEFKGKKQTLKAGGTGVIMDTIERYLARHPRDTMLAVSVKGATEQDRQKVINTAKTLVGKEYDRRFDTYDDKEMYCTETILKAWNGADHVPQFATQRHPLFPYPQAVLDMVPESMAKVMKDSGRLHQEMIMTDGIATSPDVEMVWANQNAEKSEFFKKHERWADGMAGKISNDYKEMLMDEVPNVANRSAELLEKIKELAAQTRQELSKTSD